MKTAAVVDASAEEGMANAMGERTKGYVDAGVNALNTVSFKARAMGRNADGYVRENPWIAIGVAAGAGVLLGFLLRGRRGD